MLIGVCTAACKEEYQQKIPFRFPWKQLSWNLLTLFLLTVKLSWNIVFFGIRAKTGVLCACQHSSQ